jgi:hypothetical protein
MGVPACTARAFFLLCSESTTIYGTEKPTDDLSGMVDTPATKPARNADRDDITDQPSDQERLQPETVIIDLPEVSDIPGQEHFVPAPLGILADTTISSDDEEGTIGDESDPLDLLDHAEGDEEDV